MKIMTKAICIICLVLAFPASAAEKDISGFRIGMTFEQAEAAAKKLEGDYDLNIYEAQYDYSDGQQTFQTDKFISELKVSPKVAYRPSYNLTFGSPAAGGKVIFIERHSGYAASEGPSSNNYRDSLVEKYGKPTLDYSRDPNVINLIWAEDAGKKNCITDRVPGPSFVIPLHLVKMVENSKIPPEQCGSWMQYYVTGEPVRDDAASLVDIAAFVAADKATNAWVDGLEEKAKAAVKGASAKKKPTL